MKARSSTKLQAQCSNSPRPNAATFYLSELIIIVIASGIVLKNIIDGMLFESVVPIILIVYVYLFLKKSSRLMLLWSIISCLGALLIHFKACGTTIILDTEWGWFFVFSLVLVAIAAVRAVPTQEPVKPPVAAQEPVKPPEEPDEP